MPWHKPRFRMVHLMVLVAALGVEFAILPRTVSTGVALMTLATAGLASVNGPITKVEWAILVLIHVILVALLVPAVQSSHSRRRPPVAGPPIPRPPGPDLGLEP